MDYCVEYKGLVRKWIDLKLIRQNWKRDLIGDSGKTDDDFRNELEEKRLAQQKEIADDKLAIELMKVKKDANTKGNTR